MTEVTLPDGTTRKLGNNSRGVTVPRGAMLYTGAVPNAPLIPRSEWKSRIDAMGGPGPDWPFLSYVHDQNGIGMCFPPGTLVRMASGEQRPIEDVKVLDEVLTAEGRTGRVIRTMVRRADEVLRVQTWGNRHLRCTPEHPILTKRGYVPASQLTRDDFVAMPKYAPATVSQIMTAEYLEAGCRYYTNRNKQTTGTRVYAGIPGKKAATITRHNPPDVIQLTEDFGRIIGLFLAEGSTSHGKATWSFSLKEEHTLAADLVSLVAKVFGAVATIRTVPVRNTTIVTLHGTNWAKLFESWCSYGSDGKRLHADLAAGPLTFLAAVLKGWTDGDGLGPGNLGGVTVSHRLAVTMFDIANALGLMPTIETLDVKTYGAVVSRKRRYIVKWGKFPEKATGNREADDTHMWRRVDGVVREEYSGWVHNLEVEGDNSYVAEAIGVHNCNCSATASAAESQRMKQGLPFIALSGGDLYYRICQDRNSEDGGGSLLEDGIEAMMSAGIASVEKCPYLEWRRAASGVESDRKRFRLLEAYLCPTFDACMSAVLSGFDLVSGIMWYQNYEPGADGWLPRPGGGQPGGHAVHGYKPAYRGSEFGIWHKNSWAERWGNKGRCVFPEAAYKGPVGGWWCTRSVVDEGGIVPSESS